ncbi:MAG: DUF2207 domain-containing protein [Candidatus Saccharibacteria bacterium]|nr:DUF2207 domain-containing protein [Candidatus Saccharibacteria bacterium]
MICQVIGVIFGGFLTGELVLAKSVDDFYFSNFEADYYLSREYDGTSSLKVVESFTAVFPFYDQNKGICRQIPFTNQDGANRTLPYLTESRIKLTRNGEKEPIYSIEKESNYYEVCTGTEEYLHGTQEFTFEYEFERVVTQFAGYQELYWDTNGNGWSQKFSEVTARVHFDEEITEAMTGETWCYVGKYGAKGSERCTISKISDGFSFTTIGLKAGENLTFDVEIRDGTFEVPEPEKSYFLVWAMVGIGGICTLFLISPIRKYFKSGKKREYYEGYFVKPEYQPHPKYSLAELAEVYIGKKKDSKTGVLLSMIIAGRVELVKKQSQIFKSEKWALDVKNLDGARIEELALLAILNGGEEVTVGDTVTLRVRTADAMTLRLAQKFDATVLADLRKDGLVERKYRIRGAATTASTGATVLTMLFIYGMFFAIPAIGIASTVIEAIGSSGMNIVGAKIFLPVIIAEIAATIIIQTIFKNKTRKLAEHTLLGLEVSRYMDGLEMYIRMAEADRLKFLQSVKGAPTDAKGVVKLNEKLLPYAAIFGLEKSWAKELEQYYQLHGGEAPTWYAGGYTITDVVVATRLASSYATRSSMRSSSGISDGGGSSSSFSGGGGGGSSGGGGGGGGGGGR